MGPYRTRGGEPQPIRPPAERVVKRLAQDAAHFSSLVRWVPLGEIDSTGRVAGGYHVFDLCCDHCGASVALPIARATDYAVETGRVVAWQINHRQQHLETIAGERPVTYHPQHIETIAGERPVTYHPHPTGPHDRR